MLKFKADILFPINVPPIPGGILITDNSGKIHDVIYPDKMDYEITDMCVLNGFLCPGFINSHAHLELSHLANQITPSKGLNNFILEIQDKRNNDKERILEAILNADEVMLKNGIVAVADICNSGISFIVKAKSKLYYHSFIELFGSDSNKANTVFEYGCSLLKEARKLGLNASVTPHSFYAVSSNLLNLICRYAENENQLLSLHHLESEEELHYFLNKSGPIVSRMKYFNVDIDSFNPSGKTPLQTYADLLPKNCHKLLVHNTYIPESDIVFAENLSNAFWCLCPCSNLFIENKLPNVPELIKNNFNLTVGTDSLASNTQLNILNELIVLQKTFNIDTHTLLKMATLNGAQYLKIDKQFGSFEKNKTPGIIHIENSNAQNLLLNDKAAPHKLL